MVRQSAKINYTEVNCFSLFFYVAGEGQKLTTAQSREPNFCLPVGTNARYMHYVHTLYTYAMYIRYVHMLCTYAMYIRYVHTLCTYDICICYVHTLCTYAMYIREYSISYRRAKRAEKF